MKPHDGERPLVASVVAAAKNHPLRPAAVRWQMAGGIYALLGAGAFVAGMPAPGVALAAVGLFFAWAGFDTWRAMPKARGGTKARIATAPPASEGEALEEIEDVQAKTNG